MERADGLFSGLNEEQALAVQNTEGHVRVIAGAGSGKTRALISRYCYLVRDVGISPAGILCVTFTNRAAQEMKTRVRRELGDMDLGYICTFHAFCTQFLREEINRLNFPRDFVILDKEDWREIMLRIFADMGLTLKETTVQQKIDEVLEAKKIQPETYVDWIYTLDNEELKKKWTAPDIGKDQEIFLRFLYEQKKCFGVDFNDLINFTTYILENFSDVREKWQQRMQYVMVDEFQDVSEKQYRIAQILSARHKNLFIVGDSDQTIYSWRGSHVRLILDFDKEYPDAKTFVLDKNYRSTPQILKCANTLISHNTVRYPKQLEPVRSAGPKPLYYHAAGEEDEAKWICSKINGLVRNGDPATGKKVRLSDIAILYRAHYLSRALEETFIREDMPYRILAGTEFYGRREVKDAICYLRMLTVADDTAFFRTINTPSRKIGKTKQKFLRDWAEQNSVSAYTALKENADQPMFRGTGAADYILAVEQTRDMLPDPASSAPVLHTQAKLGDVFQSILDKSGYEAFLRTEADQERLDNLAELKRAVNEAGLDDDTTLETFLQHVALFTDLDREDSGDSVKMLTIHAAKGMEFPYVFLCGMNEGVFPGRKVQTPEDMEEERRIAYVAVTRAENALYLSDCEGRANDGLFKYPSRFIFDAGLENMDLEKPLEDSLVEQARKIISCDEKRLDAMRSLFSAGDRVRHGIFGDGTITLVNADAFCYMIKFDAVETERSIQFSARLEKLNP